MTRLRILFFAALLLLVAALGYFLYNRLEWREEVVRSAPSGEALRNPYLAAMRTLTRLGYPAQRLENAEELTRLPRDATLWLLASGKIADRTKRQTLRNWVASGGHLVLALSAAAGDNPQLLDTFGVHRLGFITPNRSDTSVEVEDDTLKISLRNAEVFFVDDEELWTADLTGSFNHELAPGGLKRRDRNGEALPGFTLANGTRTSDPAGAKELETAAVFARFPLGKGFVTVGSFEAMQTEQIGEHDNARLLARLLTLPDGPRPIFVALNPDYPSLPVWLGEHAPEALFALATLVVALLWRCMPRFGPLRPTPEPHRPGLQEHLTACGDFLLRHKAYPELLAPLREQTLRELSVLHNRYPEFANLPALAAHLSGLDQREIEFALKGQADTAPLFLRHSQTLAHLRGCCARLQKPSFAPGNPS